MHEISVAQSLIDVVLEQLGEEGVAGTPVTLVRVRVGALSGVVPAALASAFGPAAAGTAVEAARLHIDLVPVAIWCDACGNDRELPEAGRLRCPICGARAARVVRGRELEVVSVELGQGRSGVLDATADSRGPDPDTQEK